MQEARVNWRQWWIVEIWQEYRELFKALVADSLIYGLFITVLKYSHKYLESLDFPKERMDILDKLHFYPVVIGLGILVCGFIIEVIVFQLRRVRR
jgi:hypothetical protein